MHSRELLMDCDNVTAANYRHNMKTQSSAQSANSRYQSDGDRKTSSMTDGVSPV